MDAHDLEAKRQEIFDRHNFNCPITYVACRKPKCPLPIASLCPRFPRWCLRLYCPSCKKYRNICMICVNDNKDFKALRSVKERTNHDALHPLVAEEEESLSENNSVCDYYAVSDSYNDSDLENKNN